MDDARLLRILTRLAAEPEPRTRGLCSVCASVIGIDGVGVTLMTGEATGPVCASDRISARVEELQYVLGEGPCVDSHRLGAPVFEPDLARGSSRWPTFGEQALEAGVGAVFAFPLRIGAVRIGAMTLYGLETGPLGDERLSDALTMADVVTQKILMVQSGATAGSLADDLAAAGEYRAEIHQASGVVSIQLDVPVADALVRLRAHAFTTGRPLRDVAAEVVARRLRLEA
jgi:ANTAR domain-containing protein